MQCGCICLTDSAELLCLTAKVLSRVVRCVAPYGCADLCLHLYVATPGPVAGVCRLILCHAGSFVGDVEHKRFGGHIGVRQPWDPSWLAYQQTLWFMTSE